VIAAPAVAVAVSPARVVVAAGETRPLHLANRGTAAAVVDVTTAGYTIGLRGRVRITGSRGALTVRPARVVVPARGSVDVDVTGRTSEPGDHPSLVLFTTARSSANLAVRVRLGVLVLVRGRGAVVHRLRLERVRVRHGRLELWLANRGNVAEPLTIRVRLGHAVLRDTRQLLPRLRAVAELRLPRRVHGRLQAGIEVASGGPILRRTLRIRV
jgi:hypothetical protein